MNLGLGLYSSLALDGSVFYLLHHIIVKANLFLIIGLMRQWGGSFSLTRLGGIYRSHGLAALLSIIPAFSLAGFPPLSGFWAKLLVIQSSLQIQYYGVAAVALAVGLMTVYSMVKIGIEAFWKPQPPTSMPMARSLSAWKLIPVGALALITLLIGLGAEPMYRLAVVAAQELMAPQAYVRAVLYGGLP